MLVVSVMCTTLTCPWFVVVVVIVVVIVVVVVVVVVAVVAVDVHGEDEVQQLPSS